jgi:hypothetical protein
MRPDLHLLVIAFGLIYPASATINGRCISQVGEYDLTTGICIKTSTCDEYDRKPGYSAFYVTGGCPYDPNDVKCCMINNCYGEYSGCTWTSGVGDWCHDGPKFISSALKRNQLPALPNKMVQITAQVKAIISAATIHNAATEVGGDDWQMTRVIRACVVQLAFGWIRDIWK